MSLTDEDVLKIISKLKKSLEQETHSVFEDLLNQLEKFTPTTERLKKTKVGVFLTNEVRKHEKANDAVKNLAKDLVNKWKKEVQAPSPAAPVKIEKKTPLKVDVEKKVAPVKRAPSEASAPATPASASSPNDNVRTVKSDGVRPKYTGNDVRDKCLDLLYKAMASNTTEDSQRVISIAETVEHHTFASFGLVGEPYKARIRTEVMNLQNKTHPQLRIKVLSGEIQAHEFAIMPVEEMASKERQEEIAAEKKKAAHDAVVGKPVQQTTDMFLCGRCKQRKCTYFQMQTRSADEPMTTFVTCTYCGHKWKSLVSTEWVAENLDRIKLVDGSWHLPTLNRNAREEYVAKHLKDARFFDIDGVSDKSSTLPHMLPSPEQFASHVGGELGISETDHVVIYDSVGIGPACRVYWTFRVFGHGRLSVLDGGLVKWLAENRPTESGNPTFSSTKYRAAFHPSILKEYGQVLNAISARTSTIIDARPAPRFQGTASEPRPGLPSGHMPNSINIPFPEVVEPNTKTLLPVEQLRQLFATKGVDLEKPIINSCGSGVTASIIYFALERAGAKNISVYDGSWSEYASLESSPIEDRGPR